MIGGGEFIVNGTERVIVTPAPPLARRRLLGRGPRRREEAALLLDHPRARLLDRAQRHQEGRPRGPHRPVGQVPRHDPAARHGRGVLDATQDIIRALLRRRRPVEDRARREASRRASSARIRGRRHRRRGDAARSSSMPLGDAITEDAAEPIAEVRASRRSRSSRTVDDPLDPEHAARGHHRVATRRRCSRSTRACARATRRSSRRRGAVPREVLRRRRATASAASAASASTASSARTSPRSSRPCTSRGHRQLDPVPARRCAPARARSTTSTTSATAASAPSPSWPATSSARAS